MYLYKTFKSIRMLLETSGLSRQKNRRESSSFLTEEVACAISWPSIGIQRAIADGLYGVVGQFDDLEINRLLMCLHSLFVTL
jgi:hypothetical protein